MGGDGGGVVRDRERGAACLPACLRRRPSAAAIVRARDGDRRWRYLVPLVVGEDLVVLGVQQHLVRVHVARTHLSCHGIAWQWQWERDGEGGGEGRNVRRIYMWPMRAQDGVQVGGLEGLDMGKKIGLGASRRSVGEGEAWGRGVGGIKGGLGAPRRSVGEGEAWGRERRARRTSTERCPRAL